jgi:hypothetical protein
MHHKLSLLNGCNTMHLRNMVCFTYIIVRTMMMMIIVIIIIIIIMSFS